MKHRKMKESDRNKLEALYNAGLTVKRISEELGFSKVTIYAELKRGMYQHRNTDWTETAKYSAYKAQRHANYQSTAKGVPLKIGNDYAFASFVASMIKKGYSPSAILDYIQKKDLHFDTKVCRGTLYNYIDKGIFRGITSKDLLRKGKMKRRKRKEKAAKSLPHFEHSIEKRPSEIRERTTFGHWEFDSVIGKQNRGYTLLSFTERKTRMQIVLRSKDKTAASTVAALNGIERRIGKTNFRRIFRTMTCDNGCEFSDTSGLEHSPNGTERTKVYYCHPYCSSERGSNENQNGFIRRFVPKGTAISRYTPQKLREIQDFINDYPRRLFNGESARAMFNRELAALGLENISHFF